LARDCGFAFGLDRRLKKWGGRRRTAKLNLRKKKVEQAVLDGEGGYNEDGQCQAMNDGDDPSPEGIECTDGGDSGGNSMLRM
jgi:hypothetical protein